MHSLKVLCQHSRNGPTWVMHYTTMIGGICDVLLCQEMLADSMSCVATLELCDGRHLLGHDRLSLCRGAASGLQQPERAPDLAWATLERTGALCLTLVDARISLELDHNWGPRLLLYTNVANETIATYESRLKSSYVHELVNFLLFLAHLASQLLQLSLYRENLILATCAGIVSRGWCSSPPSQLHQPLAVVFCLLQVVEVEAYLGVVDQPYHAFS